MALLVPGLDVWVYAVPFQNAEAGGDVHFVSSCGTGRIARLMVADVAGHGVGVSETACTLRGLIRRYMNHIDQRRFVTATVIWYDQFFGSGDWQEARLEYGIGDLTAHFADSAGPAFWLYARHFILLTHATGRDDLWHGKKPEELKADFVIWEKCFLGNSETSDSPSPEAAAAYTALASDRISWHQLQGISPISFRSMPQLEVSDRPFKDERGPVPAQVIADVVNSDGEPAAVVVEKARAIGRSVAASEGGSHAKNRTIPASLPRASR